MKRFRLRSMVLVWAAVLPILALALACGGDDRRPRRIMPDVDPEPRGGQFTVTVDAEHSALADPSLEPTAQPVTIRGSGDEVVLHAFASRVASMPGRLVINVFVENTDPRLALAGVEVTVRSSAQLHDVTRDPFDGPAVTRAIDLGGIGPEGIGRLTLAVDEPAATVELDIDVASVTTRRVATVSAPLAMSPSGDELWVAFPDADQVVLIDTRSDARLAEIAIEGKPSSVAITPDGEYVLVAARASNTLSIIDTRRRAVVQTFGEDEGIGREPRHVVVSPDGSWAFVSAYVGDRVTRLARYADRYEVRGTVAVGRRPTGMAIAPDGETLLVSHFLPRGPVAANEAWVSRISVGALQVVGETIIPDHSNVKEIACMADVVGAEPELLSGEGVASQLSGVFMRPGGGETWVPGARITSIPILERGPGAPEAFRRNPAGRFSPAFLFVFDSRDASATRPLLNPGVLDAPDANLDFVACARFGLEIELASRRLLDGDSRQVNTGAVVQAGSAGMTESGLLRYLAFSRGGRRVFGISSIADEIVVYDAMTHHPASQRHFTLSGSNPNGLVFSPDGSKAYVSYENSTFVSVLDTSAYAEPGDLPAPTYVPYSLEELPQFGPSGSFITGLRVVRPVAGAPETPALTESDQIALASRDPVDAEVRLGRILFHSSNPDKYPELSGSRQASCATCHPDGGGDGSGWATMEGERRTMSLRGGVAGRGWLHAQATHRDIREFVEIVVKERLGGAADDGDMLDVLANYVAFHVPTLQSPATDPELAEQGRAVFETSCAGCHAGAAMTSGNPDPDSPWGGGADSGPLLFDIGSSTEAAGMLIGPFFLALFPPDLGELFETLRGDRQLGAADPVQRALDFSPRPERSKVEFKAPSLVNVWDSPLLFHDGRYQTLEQAVGHLNLTEGLELSDRDITAVVEYLKTL